MVAKSAIGDPIILESMIIAPHLDGGGSAWDGTYCTYNRYSVTISRKYHTLQDSSNVYIYICIIHV